MRLVSVIIPAFNAEKTLKDTLDSVCGQTYQNLEILVMDDGSSDGTKKTAEGAGKADRRIMVRHLDHGGVSRARNAALQICHGDLIAFIDADDVMEEHMIENLVQHMDTGIDMACCGYQIRNAEGKFLFCQKLKEGIWKNDDLYQAVEMLQDKKCFNMLWNKLFRADIIRNNDLKMDPQVSMGEDFLFLISYLKCCPGSIYISSQCGYSYTLSQSGLQSTGKQKNNLRRRLEQLEKLYGLYCDRNYPIDGICMEIMRCFYTSVMESEKPAEVVEEIYSTDEYELICRKPLKYRIKYRIFLKLLQCSNIKFTVWSVKAFRCFKVLSGTAFRW